MSIDIEQWFLKTARVSRAAAARLAEVEREDLDAEADTLGLGGRLRLDELVELLEALDEASEDDDDDDAGQEGA